jgi:hypothetical protein
VVNYDISGMTKSLLLNYPPHLLLLEDVALLSLDAIAEVVSSFF